MIGSLWTGISGLAGQQTALDNESNNIANVNTIGFKSSRISFADQMYQDRIGKGTQILDAEKIYKQGNLKLTGVSYDMALSGDGFFTVKKQTTGGTAESYYTRAGNFRMGQNGTLQDASGNEVQGWVMNPLDADADIVTTNENVTRFTDAYTKLLGSQIINKSSSIETITAKATDYNKTVKSDVLSVFTGAGYKSSSSKIADIELLTTNYQTKLQEYASNPDATSSPSIAQKSWIDFDTDSATVDIASGDQIYVYINGNKYAQTFDTSEQITLQKLTDQLSNIQGINAYLAEDVNDKYPAPQNNQGKIVIQGLVPGSSITIGDVGFNDSGTTTLKTSGTTVIADAGSGYGAVDEAMKALRDAVAGEQRDVWGGTDIGTVQSDDKIRYTLTQGTAEYTITITEDSDAIDTDALDTTVETLDANLSDTNKVDSMVKAINSHSEMSKTIVAYNVNGHLVVESKEAGVEFSGKLDYALGTLDGNISLTNDINTTVQSDSDSAGKYMVSVPKGITNLTLYLDEISSEDTYQIFTKDGKHIAGAPASDTNIWTGGNTPANIITDNPTLFNGGATYVDELAAPSVALTATYVADTTTTTSTTVNYIDKNGNAATKTLDDENEEMVVIPDVTDDLVIFVNGGGYYNTSAEWTNGNPVFNTVNKNGNYSVNSAGGAEFLQIRTTVDQTASMNSIQLRLDTLGISDSAFGDFEIDTAGVITMKQDGVKYAIGQVAIAMFNSNRGLEPIGDNLLEATTESGTAIYNLNNNKTADVKGRTLELSTADLSEALVNLMVFQRAFEANAKTITTSDAVLNTLIQLKR